MRLAPSEAAACAARAGRAHRARALVGVLVALSVVLAACAPATIDAEITSATPLGEVFAPRFEIEPGATFIERFDPPGAGAGLALALATVVRNPNGFPIVLQRIDYRLRLAGERVAEAVLLTDLEVDAGSDAPLAWTVEADLTERPELWLQVVQAFANTPLAFELEGQLHFATQSYAFVTLMRPLAEGTALARQAVAPPRLRLDGLSSRVTLVRPDAPVVTLALVAHNPGDVGYFLTGPALVLELNDEPVATLELGPLPLPAGDTVRSDLTFLIDRARLSDVADASLTAALRGERADVRLLGAFAYDVLGVDSFTLRNESGLIVRIPERSLPGR